MILRFLVLISMSFIFAFSACKKENKSISFQDVNIQLSKNAAAHNYHWYRNSDGSEGGLLVLDKKADVVWIKSNLGSAFNFVQSIEINNDDLSLLPLLKNCKSIKIYNSDIEIKKKLDLKTIPDLYERITAYDYFLENISAIKNFNNLTTLNINCKAEDLTCISSSSLKYLTVRTDDVFDFKNIKDFSNLIQLKIEKANDLKNILDLSDSKLEVIWIYQDELYQKYRESFENLKKMNANLTVWYGIE